MEIWSIIILIFALSLDNFSVGITYGMRKIKFNTVSILIIASVTIFSGFLGYKFTNFLTETTAQYIGNFLLICIGIWLIYTALFNKIDENSSEYNLQDKNFRWWLRNPASFFSKIKYPDSINLFTDNYINYLETIFLAITLSFDSFSAGIGVGLSDKLSSLNIIILVLMIGFVSTLSLLIGSFIGKRFKKLLPVNFNIIPGIIIITIGLINIIFK